MIKTVLVFGMIAVILIAQFIGLVIAFARSASRGRLTSPARAVAVVAIALALIACGMTFTGVPFLLPRSGDVMQTPPEHPVSEVAEVHAPTPAGHNAAAENHVIASTTPTTAPKATAEVHATAPAGHATPPAHDTPGTGAAPLHPNTGAPSPTPLPQAAFTPAAVVAVQVKGVQRYQTFDGFGASLTIFEETGVYNRHDPAQPVVTTATREQREAIADLLYRQLGLSRLRVFLEDFEPANDNADPLTFNPSAFDWSVVDAEVSFAVLAQPYGLRTPWLSYAMEVGEKQAWLCTSPQDCTLNPAMIDEEVEWLLAGALRSRQQGIDLRYMTINNEPDLCQPPISKIAVDDYVTIIKRLGPRLRAEGLETMIVVSDGWLPVNAIEYMRAALADPEARPYIGALATHAYDEYSDSGLMMQAAAEGRPPSHAAVEIREQIRDLAAQYNLPVWITEICYCVPQGRSEFELVWTRLNHLYDDQQTERLALAFG